MSINYPLSSNASLKMPNESEYDDSSNVEEVDTPETTLLDSDEVLDPEEEILAKNRQLYERAKKAEQKAKELEDKLKTHVSDPYADNDDDWKDKFNELSSKLAVIEERAQLESIHAQYPVLKDKQAEFDEYRSANPGMTLATSAKAYLAEHDLLGQTQKRKGLEKAGGGQRTPPSGKMTADDAKRLRENNFNEYRKQLMAGKIQI